MSIHFAAVPGYDSMRPVINSAPNGQSFTRNMHKHLPSNSLMVGESVTPHSQATFMPMYRMLWYLPIRHTCAVGQTKMPTCQCVCVCLRFKLALGKVLAHSAACGTHPENNYYFTDGGEFCAAVRTDETVNHVEIAVYT